MDSTIQLANSIGCYRLRQFSDDSKPRLRSALTERHAFQIGSCLDPDGLNGFNGPAVRECLVQFLFRDSPWTIFAGFLVAKTHQEELAARLEDCRQTGHVVVPILI